jgi:hypothetical protein
VLASRRPYTFALAALLLALFSACSEDDPVEPPTEPVSFSADVQPIFNNRCAVSGCHIGPTPEADCDLSEGNSHANLVNVKATRFPGQRVTPGSPSGSVLYLLVDGGAMPQTGDDLSANQIDIIRRWIAEGAKDN